MIQPPPNFNSSMIQPPPPNFNSSATQIPSFDATTSPNFNSSMIQPPPNFNSSATQIPSFDAPEICGTWSDNCPKGYTMDPENMNRAVLNVMTCCAKCPAHCEACDSINSCNTCSKGFMVSAGKCLQCSKNCNKCSSVDFCDECFQGYLAISNGKCGSPALK